MCVINTCLLREHTFLISMIRVYLVIEMTPLHRVDKAWEKQAPLQDKAWCMPGLWSSCQTFFLRFLNSSNPCIHFSSAIKSIADLKNKTSRGTCQDWTWVVSGFLLIFSGLWILGVFIPQVLYTMVGWHHRLNGHEIELTMGDSEGQGSLVFCSPWGHKESDKT